MAVDSMLRGQTGRKLASSDFMTRHLSGRSVRVLAFGLAFLFSASRMPTRERAAGKASWIRSNLILQSDTVCQFSSGFVMIQADAKCCKTLIINVGMTREDY